LAKLEVKLYLHSLGETSSWFGGPNTTVASSTWGTSITSSAGIWFATNDTHLHTNDTHTWYINDTHCVACNAIKIGTLEQTIIAYAVGKMYESFQQLPDNLIRMIENDTAPANDLSLSARRGRESGGQL
jgi:hypothetical protein